MRAEFEKVGGSRKIRSKRWCRGLVGQPADGIGLQHLVLQVYPDRSTARLAVAHLV